MISVFDFIFLNMTNLKVPKVTLPGGLELSKLVYGTWRLAEGNKDPKDIADRIKKCVELGITSFDCVSLLVRFLR
jgi:predicted oxidoreductase